MTVASPLRVAFAGTPPFAVVPLRALLGAGHHIVCVFTQPDRPKGRGRQLTASPVKEVALSHGLHVAQPLSLRGAAGHDAVAALAALEPDVMVVVAYGQILPPEILRIPRLGCLNIHASLLPRWRGAAPIQRAILAGDPETGVTIMQMDAGLDTGPMLATNRLPISDRDTSASLHESLAALGADALLATLDALATRGLQARPQPHEGITYAQKIVKGEARIDWSRSAPEISCQVRAFTPWPVAETVFAGEPVRLHDAFASPGGTAGAAAPGSWLGLEGAALRVACGSGELRVTQLQRAGRKIVTAGEFMHSAGSTAGHFG